MLLHTWLTHRKHNKTRQRGTANGVAAHQSQVKHGSLNPHRVDHAQGPRSGHVFVVVDSSVLATVPLPLYSSPAPVQVRTGRSDLQSWLCCSVAPPPLSSRHASQRHIWPLAQPGCPCLPSSMVRSGWFCIFAIFEDPVGSRTSDSLRLLLTSIPVVSARKRSFRLSAISAEQYFVILLALCCVLFLLQLGQFWSGLRQR